MRKILIVQSIPDWIAIITNAILKEFPELEKDIISTDSFDHAITIVPKNVELTVITSEMFHDLYSPHRKDVHPKISEDEKNSDKLAQMIKEINPSAKVYVYSEYKPRTEVYLDGFIFKDGTENRNVTEIVQKVGQKELI
jgi:hypothetical protein